MTQELWTAGLEVLGPALLGIMAFFIKGYFKHLHSDVESVSKEIAKLDGQLLALQRDLRDNTVKITQATTELKALWRVIDGSYERASDNGSGHYE